MNKPNIRPLTIAQQNIRDRLVANSNKAVSPRQVQDKMVRTNINKGK